MATISPTETPPCAIIKFNCRRSEQFTHRCAVGKGDRAACGIGEVEFVVNAEEAVNRRQDIMRIQRTAGRASADGVGRPDHLPHWHAAAGDQD